MWIGRNAETKSKICKKGENDKKVSFAQTADSANSLPMKNGKPDQNIFSKFKPGGLRQRVWTALQSNKCVRCGGDHLRQACSEAEKAWEKDFNVGAAFWAPKTKKSTGKIKEQRAQTFSSPDPNQSASSVLEVSLCAEQEQWVALDTCSDVSMAEASLVSNLRVAKEEVSLNTAAGLVTFSVEGDLVFPDGFIAVVLVVPRETLPNGCCALLGVEDLKRGQVDVNGVLYQDKQTWVEVRKGLGEAKFGTESAVVPPKKGWFRIGVAIVAVITSALIAWEFCAMVVAILCAHNLWNRLTENLDNPVSNAVVSATDRVSAPMPRGNGKHDLFVDHQISDDVLIAQSSRLQVRLAVQGRNIIKVLISLYL